MTAAAPPLPPLVAIAGPTGVGKSALAVALAEALGGEIVNYDSLQVYRGFDIGTAKPSEEERSVVPHHLFDIVEADEEFNAAAWAERAREVCAGIAARGGVPLLVGGTGFYLRALLSGLPEMPPRDPELRRRIGRVAARPGGQLRLHRWLSKIDPQSGRKIAPADRHRVERALEVYLTSGRPISSWQAPSAAAASGAAVVRIGLTMERRALVQRLDARVDAMYAAGLIEETRQLLLRYPRTAHPFGSIGYREAAAVVAGEMTAAEAAEETKRRTRAYAKRQMTWLRAEPDVHWFNASAAETPRDALTLVRNSLSERGTD